MILADFLDLSETAQASKTKLLQLSCFMAVGQLNKIKDCRKLMESFGNTAVYLSNGKQLIPLECQSGVYPFSPNLQTL